MGIRLDKDWRRLSADEVARLPGQLGVYQIRGSAGEIVRIGYAGGRSLFGLRGLLAEELAARDGPGFAFRVEVTMQYLSRWQELLMLHQADHGELPRDNRDAPDLPRDLGRLSPA